MTKHKTHAPEKDCFAKALAKWEKSAQEVTTFDELRKQNVELLSLMLKYKGYRLTDMRITPEFAKKILETALGCSVIFDKKAKRPLTYIFKKHLTPAATIIQEASAKRKRLKPMNSLKKELPN